VWLQFDIFRQEIQVVAYVYSGRFGLTPAHNNIIEIQGIEDMHDVSVCLWNATGQHFILPVISPQRFEAYRISPGFYIVEIESDGIRYFRKLIME
jgi:hypothetical protein